jgi:hypothetical protein
VAATINADVYRVPPGINRETPMTNARLVTSYMRIVTIKTRNRITYEGIGAADFARVKAP